MSSWTLRDIRHHEGFPVYQSDCWHAAFVPLTKHSYIDGMKQDCGNSIALAMNLPAKYSNRQVKCI